MSQNRGPFATAYNRLEQLQKCNNRIERCLASLNSTKDDPDTHTKLETDRQQSLKLCLEVKELLDAAPAQNPQRSTIAKALASEMTRFESLSKELKSKDIELNRQNAKKPQNAQQQQGGKGGKKSANKALGSSMNDYDPLLMDDEEENQAMMQEQLSKELLLTEEQDQSIDIEQMQRRKQEIQQIETDVQTLATMFQDLQQMVYEQGEQLDVIEENIITTQTNSEEAYVELEQAEEHQIASSRSLKYLMMIGIVALIAVVVTAVVLYVNHQKKDGKK